jgi:hypothetical protein
MDQVKLYTEKVDAFLKKYPTISQYGELSNGLEGKSMDELNTQLAFEFGQWISSWCGAGVVMHTSPGLGWVMR